MDKQDSHRGKFVGAYLSDDQYNKLIVIESHLEKIFGPDDVSRSKVLRYIIDYFDMATLPQIPKGRAPALTMGYD